MVDMNKENTSANYEEEPTVRITRARAKALSAGETQKPPRPDQKRLIRMNSKRAASDENKPTFSAATSLQNKRRAVLTDVTNTHCDGSYMACLNAAKIQTNKQTKRNVMRKNLKATSALPTEIHHAQDVKEKIAEDISKLSMESRHVNVPVGATVVGDTSKLAKKHHDDLTSGELKEYSTVGPIASSTPEEFSLEDVFADRSSKCSSRLHRLFKKDARASKVSGTIDYPHVVDVDSKQKDPLMCNLYAPDIYENKRVMELKQRPPTKYMETVQRDITESMRGILIDWLVEVSEEYKLVPDTLYLTVNLIDRFLSGNYIEKQRLQLLGVTCMLIASKYEEICAPRVEEFCFITDNTYTREEVLKMECQALNFLCFHLATPTIKTFLRRFIQAAQATYEDPNVDLEFLANYLAELTLIDYNFLKFLPSLIAASAVFLARWTLDQSVHPWNPTLEHYTCYKAADLKSMVIAMQALQINANSCPLSSIREKYKRPKFNAVANFPSPKPVISLF